MKKNRFLKVFALTGVLILGLTACGSKKGNSYDDVVELLEKGQYDAAITKIEEYKEKAQAEGEKSTAEVDVDEADAELLQRLVGYYELSPSCYGTGTSYYNTVTINEDMTITCDGDTYPFTLDHTTDGYGNDTVRLSYKPNESVTRGFNINENSKGYIDLDRTYLKLDTMQADADALWSQLVGTYIDNYGWDGFNTLELKSDYTAVFDDDTTYPVKFSYSVSSEDKTQGWFSFYIIRSVEVYNSPISYSISEDGEVDVYNVIKQAQVEYVEITADNFWDYFEWTDYEVDQVRRDAFDDLYGVTYAKYLKLKDEYSEKFLKDYSDVAIEFTYDNLYALNATVVWDTTANTVTVDEGDIKQDEYTPTLTNIFSSVNGNYNNEKGGYDFYYLNYISENFNKENETVTIDGSIWTLTDEHIPGLGLTPEHSQITRSQTTLAFKNIQ